MSNSHTAESIEKLKGVYPKVFNAERFLDMLERASDLEELKQVLADVTWDESQFLLPLMIGMAAQGELTVEDIKRLGYDWIPEKIHAAILAGDMGHQIMPLILELDIEMLREEETGEFTPITDEEQVEISKFLTDLLTLGLNQARAYLLDQNSPTHS